MIFGASVRGPDHEREGLPCQDAWARGATEETTAVCLCDGAGTASHAEIGAGVVASAVVSALRGATPGQGLHEAVLGACHAGRRALLQEAEARALAPHDLACTLVVVVARGSQVAVAHIGDGAVVGRRSGEVFVLSPPDGGEYAGETWFISSPSWEERLRLALHDDVDAFCAFTDGCQAASLVKGPEVTPFAPFCDPLFDFAGEVADADAAGDEVRDLLDAAPLRRSSGDDKTLAVARLRAAM